MGDHYTNPSGLTRALYRFVLDPLRAGYFRRLVSSLDLTGAEDVLDFGSGAGSEAVHLARALTEGGRLTCLDVSPVWLAEARRRLRGRDNVTYLLGSALDAGLPEGSFDLVVAHFVLHDVDRAALPGTLEALAGALKPGGRFVVVEPAAGHVSRHALAPDELRLAMTTAGLHEESAEPIRQPFAPAIEYIFWR
jgi:ubiquinone/menaquinone biosynthesis C-methylase UbiE